MKKAYAAETKISCHMVKHFMSYMHGEAGTRSCCHAMNMCKDCSLNFMSYLSPRRHFSYQHHIEEVAMSTKRSNDGTARDDDAKKSKTDANPNRDHHLGNPNESDAETLSIPSQDYRQPAEQSSPCTDDSPYKYDHGPTKAGSQMR